MLDSRRPKECTDYTTKRGGYTNDCACRRLPRAVYITHAQYIAGMKRSTTVPAFYRPRLIGFCYKDGSIQYGWSSPTVRVVDHTFRGILLLSYTRGRRFPRVRTPKYPRTWAMDTVYSIVLRFLRETRITTTLCLTSVTRTSTFCSTEYQVSSKKCNTITV